MTGASNGVKKTFLLIEDNPGDARLIEEALVEAWPDPFTLLQASYLREGIKLLAKEEIDLVLLDLSLPDGSGMETVITVTSAAPSVPVVVLTGLADESMAIKAVQQGAQDYLIKGQVEPGLLARALRYAIERHLQEENARRLIREQTAREEAEAHARRSRFLAEASRVLAASLDYRGALKSVASLAVPDLADLCIVDILEPRGVLSRIAVAHGDPCQAELARALLRFPIDPERQPDHPALQALRTKASLVFPTIPRSYFEASSLGPEHQEVWERLGMGSSLFVPMQARGRTLGVVAFFSSRSSRYSPEDLSLAEDFTARAALTADNARLYQEAQEAARARDEFLGVVSHDLRNPLNVIVLNADILRQKKEIAEGPCSGLVARIARSAEQMSRLIQDYLDVTRIEAGALFVEKTFQDIAPLIAEAIEMHRPLAAEKGISLQKAAPPALPDLDLDRARILQVFSNLFGNAIKFTPSGGQVSLEVEVLGREICFSIRDNGPGIDAEHLPHIFDRFWQGKELRSQGTGLGLAIAKGIVETHRGRLRVESEPGVGSVFSFTLPLGG